MRFQKVFNPILLSSKAKALRRRRVHLCDPYLSTVSWRIQDRLCIFSLCFSFLFPHHTSLHIPTYLLLTPCWVQRHSPFCQGQTFGYILTTISIISEYTRTTTSEIEARGKTVAMELKSPGGYPLQTKRILYSPE